VLGVDGDRVEDGLVPILDADAPAQLLSVDGASRERPYRPRHTENGLEARPHHLVLVLALFRWSDGRTERLHPMFVPRDALLRADNSDVHAGRVLVRGGRTVEEQAVFRMLGGLAEAEGKGGLRDMDHAPTAHATSPSSELSG
jgi:hypothetical protein